MRNVSSLFRLVKITKQCVSCRYLSASEAATALRPFYFTVHPDLFGQHPQERSINEDSLKRLHQYIFSLRKDGKVDPIKLNFYAKRELEDATCSHELNPVTIHLKSQSIRDTVTTILTSCQLPLDYVNTIPRVIVKKSEADLEKYYSPEFTEFFGRKQNAEFYREKETRSLLSWLEKNAKTAKENKEIACILEEEIAELCHKLKLLTNVKDIQWHTNWGRRRYTACLTSLERLTNSHPKTVRRYLKGRNLVISDRSGVSLSGEVVLNNTDVPQEWLKRMSAIPAYDAVLERLPYMEWELSRLLRNIQIKKRKHNHIVMADEYEVLLNNILNTLRRNQDSVNKELRNIDLSHLELVVEGPSGPLYLTNLGQYLVPVSMPGPIIVQYISQTRQQAYHLLRDAKVLKLMEKEAIQQCKSKFKFEDLEKDANISPSDMTSCCERLMDDFIELDQFLTGCPVRVTQYYSVMDDGEVCIPWNWKSGS